MTALLLSLLEEHSRNEQIGLPTSALSVCASDEDLEELLAHFKRESQDAEEFLMHAFDVAQSQVMEQQILWDDVDKFIKEYSAQVDPNYHPPTSHESTITSTSSYFTSYPSYTPLKNEQEGYMSTPTRLPHKYTAKQSHSPPMTSSKKRTNFSREITQVLTEWLVAHYDHPYPSEQEKEALGQQVGLKVSQISGWFINARRRKLRKDPSTNTFNLHKK